jgi:hypothetical protein
LSSGAQADWYEAYADLGGERQELQVFSLQSMASGAAFHRPYPRATQQAFLEAHELAFRHYGGVFHRLGYDNRTSAVKRILHGHQREETARFVRFRSHWGFQAEFCTPAAAHEKSGVEGEAGYFHRNHWAPVPEARDLEELNDRLLRACQQDQQRQLAGWETTIGATMQAEQEHILPLPGEGFDLVEVSFPRVDGSGCVQVRTNFYSAPVRAGSVVEARGYPAGVEFWAASVGGPRMAETGLLAARHGVAAGEMARRRETVRQVPAGPSWLSAAEIGPFRSRRQGSLADRTGVSGIERRTRSGPSPRPPTVGLASSGLPCDDGVRFSPFGADAP